MVKKILNILFNDKEAAGKARLFIGLIIGCFLLYLSVEAIGIYGLTHSKSDQVNKDIILLGSRVGLVVLLVVLFILRIVSIEKKRIMFKQAVQKKALMFREVNHRIKNNLYMLKSFFFLQAEYVSDMRMKQILKNCESRLNAMLVVHKQLYKIDTLADLDTYKCIKELLDILIGTYYPDPHDVDLALQIEEMVLDLDTVISCSLIINEIVSNSLKYAKVASGKPKISLRFFQIDEEHISLIIGDNGSGIPDKYLNKEEETFGLLLIDLLIKQINGTYEVTTSAGTHYAIHITQKKEE